MFIVSPISSILTNIVSMHKKAFESGALSAVMGQGCSVAVGFAVGSVLMQHTAQKIINSSINHFREQARAEENPAAKLALERKADLAEEFGETIQDGLRRVTIGCCVAAGIFLGASLVVAVAHDFLVVPKGGPLPLQTVLSSDL